MFNKNVQSAEVIHEPVSGVNDGWVEVKDSLFRIEMQLDIVNNQYTAIVRVLSELVSERKIAGDVNAVVEEAWERLRGPIVQEISEQLNLRQQRA